MPNPHTDQDEVAALAIYNIILANQTALELDDVLWGNQTLFPRASTAVVMAMGKRRELAGVTGPGGRTLNTLMVVIEIHRSKVGDEGTQRKIIDATATAVELLIHVDTTLGGIVIHGFVAQVDRGETNNESGMFRTVRMQWLGQTKTYLSVPSA